MTSPVVEPMVAIEVVVLIQVPPPPSVSVVVYPTHTLVGKIKSGKGFTVTITEAKHPVPGI